MEEKQNRPFAVADAVTNIRHIGNCLKNLYQIVNSADGDLEGLSWCREITEIVLEKQIKAINYDLGQLAGEFEDAEYKPIEL